MFVYTNNVYRMSKFQLNDGIKFQDVSSAVGFNESVSDMEDELQCRKPLKSMITG